MKSLAIKRGFKIFGVWLALLALLYILLETTFFYYATRIFPLAALSNAGIGAGILLQYSKKNTYPHGYIAIHGDSYAMGQGDWLLQGEHAIRPPYSAAHLLYEKLGRDVITFGFPASDSIRANNILPKVFRQATEKSTAKKLEDPDMVIVYFYEGNDINDNVEVAERLILPALKDKNTLYDSTYFQSSVLPELVNSNELIKQVETISWVDRLFFFNFAKNTMVEGYRKYRSGKIRAPWKPPKNGITTQVEVGGTVSYLPDRLQSPALSLDAEEIKLGLYVFEQSLIALQKNFPDAPVGIAYIPAVITPYHVVSPVIHDYYKHSSNARQRMEQTSRIRSNSDAICEQVRTIALTRGIGFVDSRSRLRAVAKNSYIHGPIDWNHFNRLGYETFTEELMLLVQQLEQTPASYVPECRWERSS